MNESEVVAILGRPADRVVSTTQARSRPGSAIIAHSAQLASEHVPSPIHVKQWQGRGMFIEIWFYEDGYMALINGWEEPARPTPWLWFVDLANRLGF